MGHNIQIVQTMANQITQDITANIWNNFYLIIYDEYTDISNQEQLSFCIRWVDKFLPAHEELLGFYEDSDMKSETLVKVIKDILLRFQLSLQLCRGQFFDGASNMLEKKTWCCHSNLQRGDVTISFKMFSDVMETAGEIFVIIKFPPKLLEKLKEQTKNSEQITPNKITKLSTTRWTVRTSALVRN